MRWLGVLGMNAVVGVSNRRTFQATIKHIGRWNIYLDIVHTSYMESYEMSHNFSLFVPSASLTFRGRRQSWGTAAGRHVRRSCGVFGLYYSIVVLDWNWTGPHGSGGGKVEVCVWTEKQATSG